MTKIKLRKVRNSYDFTIPGELLSYPKLTFVNGLEQIPAAAAQVPPSCPQASCLFG